MSKDLIFLVDLVKQASKLITNDMVVKAKGGHGDLVTNFDYEIEKYLIEKINEKYPDFTIISEEFNTNNKLTNNCFTIDPIDGTINFANNIPLWGIQMACIKERETVAAVIFLPELNELYYADENGAFLNGEKISVNNHDITRGLYTIAGPNKLQCQMRMLPTNIHYREFFSAAVNYAWTACGRLSAVYFSWNTLWDYIPGQYLVKQAGGVIFNDKNTHLAANTNNFLERLKKLN